MLFWSAARVVQLSHQVIALHSLPSASVIKFKTPIPRYTSKTSNKSSYMKLSNKPHQVQHIYKAAQTQSNVKPWLLKKTSLGICLVWRRAKGTRTMTWKFHRCKMLTFQMVVNSYLIRKLWWTTIKLRRNWAGKTWLKLRIKWRRKIKVTKDRSKDSHPTRGEACNGIEFEGKMWSSWEETEVAATWMITSRSCLWLLRTRVGRDSKLWISNRTHQASANLWASPDQKHMLTPTLGTHWATHLPRLTD